MRWDGGEGRRGLPSKRERKVCSESGVFDRVSDHSVVFDIDGTVCAVRQRVINTDARNDPPAVRRSEGVCAPGYTGRKRGEVIRNRTVVCVAQTGEWLGTYGSAGNGEAKPELERCCGVIVRYLEQQGLVVGHGLVRLDGLYYTAALVSVVQATGLGYLLRCRDYHILKDEKVKRRVEDADANQWQRIENIDPTRTKTKSPQTNGICERFHRTILEAFYQIAFRKTLYSSMEQLQQDVDDWIDSYNCARPHSGRYCYGKTPMQTFLDSKAIVQQKLLERQFEEMNNNT